MSDTFAAFAFPWVLTAEGHLSLDPVDPGNWTGGERDKGELRGTKYGISAKAYPHMDIRSLTLEDAREIYRRDYWIPTGCDQMPLPIALAVFDQAVNMGPSVAVKALQLALRVSPDGVMGPETLAAAKGATVEAVLPDLLSHRAFRYARIGDMHHMRGWMLRLFRLQLHCLRVGGLHGASHQ